MRRLMTAVCASLLLGGAVAAQNVGRPVTWKRAVLLAPAPIDGQRWPSDLHCQWCEESDHPLAPVAHKFEGGTCSGGDLFVLTSATPLRAALGSDGCMDCHLFNSCHSDEQVGSCQEWHYACGSAFEDARVRARELRTRRNYTALLASASNSSAFVRYNRERHAVQVLNCRAVVVAHYALPPQPSGT